jgi:gas vesicle protein
MRANKLPQTVLGFAVGLGVGAALGLLFAPKSGEDTRENLLAGASGAIDDAVGMGRKFTRRAKQSADQVVDDVTQHVKDAADAGERAYTKAKSA